MDNEKNKRNIILRVVSFIIWAVLFEIAASILVGQFFILLSGENLETEQGMINAQLAFMKFMASYGGAVILTPLLLVSVLAYFNILPWTSKFKRAKHS